MKKIYLIAMALFTLGACEYETVKPVVVEIPDTGVPISFATQIQPMFTSKCITCHSGQTPILTAGNAYNSLSNGYLNTTSPAQSLVYTKPQGGHPGGSNNLTATELAYLLKWIEEGAKNN
jgi:hypothetical protein